MFGTNFPTSPAPAPVQDQAEPSQHQHPRPLQNRGSFPGFSGVVQRVKNTIEWTAEWSQGQSDPWAKTFGSRNKVVTSTENETMAKTLKNQTGLDFDEVDPFFGSNPSSRSLEHQARRVKGFCGDTTRLLTGALSSDLESTQSDQVKGPKVWVSDREWYPEDSEVALADRKSYGRILDDKDFQMVLSKTRFSQNDDREIGPPRRIYIDKPDKNSIIAILKTTPPSQVAGFRELLANYITDAPTPVMSSREIFWWGSMCFLFSFNLPFFAMSTQTEKDNRMLWHGKQPLRRRHDLSFLNLKDPNRYQSGRVESSSAISEKKPFLVEGVCSIVVTGRTDRYWTAACLDDDLCDEEDEPRLSIEGEEEEEEEEEEKEEQDQEKEGGEPGLSIEDEDDPELEPDEDPIILKVYNKTQSPRAYALAALATSLAKIADYHKDIQHQFGTSLNRHTPNSWYGTPENTSSQPMKDWRKRYPEVLEYVIHYNSRLIEKLEYFFSHHLMLTPEGLPQHPLWQSVHKEERVMQCLADLRDILDSLRDVDSELRRFLQTCIEARRERKSDYQYEQVSREKTLHKITFAGFALGILNLVAQIYAARPENASSLSSPGFMALIWGSFGLCLIICLIPFWTIIYQYLMKFRDYMCSVLTHLVRFLGEQLQCLKGFLELLRHFRVRRIGVWLRRKILMILRWRRRRVFTATSPV
ncbi:hypothetical protein FOQG_03408 [Fusarium oxysporum f. sp. raphani 54005]|uniref:Uncharacterized protein n=2 Tax=Fusarium oxysporum TaxID=5507 RepID=X0CYH1_FUSOX|nr:hypothetical protein FOVG_00323 [Fusarium oxysporum f. sp. pisi HDV247]EXK96331.1 hypothetical protein FOQG_03408 [Fusarium oxysporum f. sp. raphani 54005]EXA51768.1 hypothetical protein FOVG_00323 [Fusarium oxysporum f. sp. pisi HDV247]EXA51769.1 hypothetical protein FOVG_00323 [Fusarium oxysporum f. sp. pisi HDV247]EXA51770.1 hypothetical protein FOVG_00323 [Fusarium oxysporum f. sp. pisi HDV247]